MKSWITLTLLMLVAGCGQDRESKANAGNSNLSDVDTAATDMGSSNSGTAGPVPSESLEVCGGGWCWVNPKPFGATLHAAHGADGAVFIVGSGGTILQRADGRWTSHITGDTHLYDVFAVRSDLAYAVGIALDATSAAHVHRWDGSSWELVHTIESDISSPIGPLFTPAGVWASESEVYVGVGAQVHHFDGQWQALETPGGNGWIADIACTDDTCVAVGQVGSHLRFAEEGFIWRREGAAFIDEAVPVGALTSVDVRPDGSFIAAGVSGPSAVLATQGGPGWEVSSDAPGAIADLVVGPDAREWAASTTFTSWNVHARGAGEAWADQALPLQRGASLGPSRNIPGLYASAAELFFVGRSDWLTGEVARYDGSAWDTFTPTADPAAEFVDVSVSGTVAAAATQNSTFIWDLASGERSRVEIGAQSVWVFDERVFVVGGSISEVTGGSAQPLAGAPDSVEEFFGLSAEAMFAAAGKTISRYDGATWVADDIPEDNVTVRGLWARAPNDAFAVVAVTAGAAAIPALWHFDGTSWRAVDGSPTEALDDVVLAGTASQLLVVGIQTSSASVFTYDGATVTEVSDLGFQVSDAVGLPDGEFLATTNSGAIFRGGPGEWAREPQLVEARLNAVAADASGNAWVAGVSGALLRFSAP